MGGGGKNGLCRGYGGAKSVSLGKWEEKSLRGRVSFGGRARRRFIIVRECGHCNHVPVQGGGGTDTSRARTSMELKRVTFVNRLDIVRVVL